MSAANNGRAECVAALLPASDWAARDASGRTALQLAVASNRPDCADLLASHPNAMPEARREALDKIGKTAAEQFKRMPNTFALVEGAILAVVADTANARRAAGDALATSTSSEKQSADDSDSIRSSAPARRRGARL